jgi:integrase
MRRPFTLYKEMTKSGTFWYARFWDETARKYNRSRSTGVLVEGKKERRFEAEEAARKLLAEITATPTPQVINTVAVYPTVTQAQHPQQQPTAQKGISKVADMPLIVYLENFWTPESEYANFKNNVQKTPLTPSYIQMNHDDVRRHVQPFPGFEGITVGSLNKAILKKYLIWLAGRRKQYKKKDGTITIGEPISGHRANSILQSVRVAVRWAADNDEIPTDPFRKLGDVTEFLKEKGVLTLEERNNLIKLPQEDYRYRLIMLLGCLCGMRRGEMRGLQWGDIEGNIIHIRHNFVDKEAVKKPKYNSVRKVPIPTAVQELLGLAHEKAFDTSPTSYVLASPIYPDKPLNNNFFREGVKKELSALGITEAQQKERFITCHSLRHTFITLAQISGIPDVVISALAGHKSLKTTGKYSHVPQVIDFNEARTKIDSSYLPVKDEHPERKVANL